MTQRLSGKFECRLTIARLGHEALEDFAFMICGAPEIMCLTINLPEHLIDMPAPLPPGPHSVNALAADRGPNIGPNLPRQKRMVS